MVPKRDFAAMIAGLESAGMTRTEIASAAHVSRNTVWRLATGESRQPSHDIIERLRLLENNHFLVRHLEQKKA